MKETKILKNNYTVHFINTDRFKTTNVEMCFSHKFDKHDSSKSNLLLKMLSTTTKKYNSFSKFNIELEKLYGLMIRTDYKLIGNVETMVFNMEFLDPQYTTDVNIASYFNFAKECLLNPNIIDSKFDKEIFDLNKKNLLNIHNSIKENSLVEANIKYDSIMFQGTSAAYFALGIKKDLENITRESLYEFYNTLLTDYKIDVFVLGNLKKSDEKKYINLLDKLFAKFKSNIIEDVCLEMDVKLNKYEELKQIKKDDTQSHLFVGYKFKDLTDYERNYVIRVYNIILGVVNNSILFTEVREKKSLCYSINSRVGTLYPSLTIIADINSKNYKKSLNIIKSCVRSMNDKQVIGKLYNSAIKSINTFDNNFYDSIGMILNYFYTLEFKEDEDIETRKKILMSVKIDEIIELNKKIILSLVYFSEGTLNEKNKN